MKCRVCGCTDSEPCIGTNGETCAWSEVGLCDFCADVDADAPMVQLYSEGDLNRVLAARAGGQL